MSGGSQSTEDRRRRSLLAIYGYSRNRHAGRGSRARQLDASSSTRRHAARGSMCTRWRGGVSGCSAISVMRWSARAAPARRWHHNVMLSTICGATSVASGRRRAASVGLLLNISGSLSVDEGRGASEAAPRPVVSRCGGKSGQAAHITAWFMVSFLYRMRRLPRGRLPCRNPRYNVLRYLASAPYRADIHGEYGLWRAGPHARPRGPTARSFAN